MNGEAVEAAQRSFEASYGPAAAADCEVVVEEAAAPWECGRARAVRLQPKELKHGGDTNLHAKRHLWCLCPIIMHAPNVLHGLPNHALIMQAGG